MGKVSIVVVMGLSAQAWNDWWISQNAEVNPKTTINIQRNLVIPFVKEIYERPWIVEDSKNVLIPTIVIEWWSIYWKGGLFGLDIIHLSYKGKLMNNTQLYSW